MVVGAGMSAITTINGLRELAAAAGDEAGVEVVWATRRGTQTTEGGDGAVAGLYERVDNDPLPQRDRLAALANDYTTGTVEREVPGMNLRHIPYAQVSAIRKPDDDADDGSGGMKLEFAVRDGDNVAPVSVVAHNVIANVGYRPNSELYQELQIHQCYASEGPMKLAAALMAS